MCFHFTRFVGISFEEHVTDDLFRFERRHAIKLVSFSSLSFLCLLTDELPEQERGEQKII